MAANSNQIRAGGAFVEVAADTAKAEKNLKGLGATLDMLKKGLGEESQAGGLFKILAGTGAVAGLSLATRLLSDMTAKAVELSDAFKDGAKSAGDVTEELWQSLPILGDLRKTGLSIRELFDGEARAIRMMGEGSEKVNTHVANMRGLIAASTKEWERHLDVVEAILSRTSLIGKKGYDRATGETTASADSQRRQMEREAKTNRDALEAKAKLDKEALRLNMPKVPDPKVVGAVHPETGESLGTVVTNQSEVTAALQENARLNNLIVQRDNQLADDIAQNRRELAEKILAIDTETSRQMLQNDAEEMRRQRDLNDATADRVKGLEDEAAATRAQAAAATALTDAEAAHAQRMQEVEAIRQEREKSIRAAQQQAADDINKLGAEDQEAATRRIDDLGKELAAIEAIAAAKNDASGQRAALAQLNSVFDPLDAAMGSMKGSIHAGAMDDLSDFFDGMEDAYADLRSRVWDSGGGGATFGTFSGAAAEQGGGNAAVQKLTDIAKYAKLQYLWSKNQGGVTFQ